ncbi:hypothetical protein Q5752_004910 [Cryptotrichosporon argae]
MPRLPASDPSNDNVVVFDVDTTAADLPPGEDVPVYFRGSPSYLISNDLGIVLRNAWKIPLIFYPFPALGVDVSNSGVVQQVVATVASLALTAAVLASAALPIAGLTAIALWLFIRFMNWVQGGTNRLVVSAAVPGEEAFGNEEWFFINGIATNNNGSQLACDALAKLFRRKITGICNRTDGIWFDLVQCLIQRDLLWPTADVRVGYEYLSAAIRRRGTKRIVLIAHSQGGIIASVWVDQLLADFAPDQLRDVEVYTFASASNHFSAPTAPKMSSPFGNIEHFANELDFVADIGVLSFAPDWKTVKNMPELAAGSVRAVPGRFAGRVFVREGATGHLLLTHYISKDDSILDTPSVIEFSRLHKYKKGGDPVVTSPNTDATSLTTPPSTQGDKSTESTSNRRTDGLAHGRSAGKVEGEEGDAESPQ